jgi:hypothetical protein
MLTEIVEIEVEFVDLNLKANSIVSRKGAKAQSFE